MTVYRFKIPDLYPVDAQTAGEELERIYNSKGRLEPKDIVEESRPENAPLHPCFEWDDAVAAEKYREVQAGNLVRCIVTECETKEKEIVEVRAFPCVQQTYTPIEVVVNSEDKMDELLRNALSDLIVIKKKYKVLKELSSVFDEIDDVLAKNPA